VDPEPAGRAAGLHALARRATPPPVEPRGPAGSARAARSPVYRFTDDEGTVIWTNQVERVPEPLRRQTRPNATSP
jgi:hypothetical protein